MCMVTNTDAVSSITSMHAGDIRGHYIAYQHTVQLTKKATPNLCIDLHWSELRKIWPLQPYTLSGPT